MNHDSFLYLKRKLKLRGPFAREEWHQIIKARLVARSQRFSKLAELNAPYLILETEKKLLDRVWKIFSKITKEYGNW